MSFSVQLSVVESFKFNGKNIRAFYIKDVGQCLISQGLYTAVGYNKENGVKTLQRLVPEKYKIRFGDVGIEMKEVDKNIHLHPDMVLLKELCLYCFFLRCKIDEAKPFVELAVETVLPREVQKLASAIEEKDAALALLNDDLKNCEYENVALQVHSNVYQAQLQKCQDSITHLKTRHVDHRRDSSKDKIIITVQKKTQGLLTISSMTCHILSLWR